MPKKPGRRPGAKIKDLTDRDKFVSKRKSNGTEDGDWKVVKGILKFVPKK